MIPISENIIQPIIKSNILYVNSIEEFENIKLEPNQTILSFDNNKNCFYLRERDRHGEYSAVKIFFYENFAERVQRLEKDEFVLKCQKAGLDSIKTEVACMFFVENKKPYDVWIWALNNKIDWEWDYVRNLRYRLKVKLFKKVI